MGEIRGKIDKDAQPFPVKLPFRVRDFIYGGAEDAGMELLSPHMIHAFIYGGAGYAGMSGWAQQGLFSNLFPMIFRDFSGYWAQRRFL